MVIALMGMFAVSLLLTMIQLNIESYHEHEQKLDDAVKALAACQDGSQILAKVCDEVKLRATTPTTNRKTASSSRAAMRRNEGAS
ncbi:unnamed protein product, partial [Tilletia controversa]